ncbi:magnesium transporter [Halovulum dunhuangense]|uniref:Magnesium transporter MgtE n=1 Tax=Halovulum dunhuangense TaxID=1505036 RepID=A0A849L121_9RHOB|nr:magnesium transporter [Halovulum dunhuangense]NNU79960.1 magnesium transporter [Halovulum dunhuangense]
MSDTGFAPEGGQDEGFALNAGVVEAILAAVEAQDQDLLVDLLGQLHEADQADLLEQVSPQDRESLVRLWGERFDGAVLYELEEGVRDEILEIVDPRVLASAVQEMETDDLVYLVEDMEDAQKAEVLGALDDADRVAVEASLQYEEYTAGRLMSREMVTCPPHWTVGEAIDFMRASEDLPETFYKVILVDPRMHVAGTVALGSIMANRREVKLIDLADTAPRLIRADQPNEDVAYLFNHYHMVSAPVVDGDGRLVGVITIDDAMEILEEEVEEDIMRLGGVGDEELSDSVWETARARFPWLAVNLVTAIIASLVIALFEDTIEAIVALAVLMPIIASMGGNAATQTLTVAVRALATRDLTRANAWRIIRRETLVGLGNGIAFAVIIAGVGLAWFGSPMLGVVLALAMVINLLVAGLSGILIPMALEKAGADPALASGTFVTTVTDVVGFFAFLGLAGILLL